MGDGGFWHNGLSTGVSSAVFNKNDSILVIMKNGYASATGAQNIPSSRRNAHNERIDMGHRGGAEGRRRQVAQDDPHLQHRPWCARLREASDHGSRA